MAFYLGIQTYVLLSAQYEHSFALYEYSFALIEYLFAS